MVNLELSLPLGPLVETQDGSLSIFDETVGELHHNKVGAYTEALYHHVIPSGILETFKNKEHLSIIDACFGLGYNTWVFLAELLKILPQLEQNSFTPNSDSQHKLFSVDIFVIDIEPKMSSYWNTVLDFPKLKQVKEFIDASEHNIYYQTLEKPFHKMTFVAEKSPFSLNFYFLWGDLRSQIQRLNLQNNQNAPFVDAIFHDAFSPRKIPELWTQDLFNEYIKLLNPGGVLTTYSVSKPVRQGLYNAGFKLFDTQKLGTKKGGTLAMSCLETLTLDPSLIPVDIDSLLRECVEPYRDLSLCLTSEEIHQNRNAKMIQKRAG